MEVRRFIPSWKATLESAHSSRLMRTRRVLSSPESRLTGQSPSAATEDATGKSWAARIASRPDARARFWLTAVGFSTLLPAPACSLGHCNIPHSATNSRASLANESPFVCGLWCLAASIAALHSAMAASDSSDIRMDALGAAGQNRGRKSAASSTRPNGAKSRSARDSAGTVRCSSGFAGRTGADGAPERSTTFGASKTASPGRKSCCRCRRHLLRHPDRRGRFRRHRNAEKRHCRFGVLEMTLD